VGAGQQVAQQCMQLVDQPGALADHVAAALIQQPQNSRQVIGGNKVGIPAQGGDGGRGRGIDDIVLAPSAARELPHPCRRSCGHVLDDLAARDKPLSQMPAQPAGVLHRHRRFPKPAAHFSSRR
jgi:hypothetical protein